ncbi:MAG: DUF5652 family protein [Candidatus Pacearchaeota archaeon]|jgi:sterol desaturase/sphingolipid hydroxylase (fatty acid hydroxylase superfamily)
MAIIDTGYETLLYQKVGELLSISQQRASILIGIFLLIIFTWKLIWHGLALYKAIEKKHKVWFVVLFVTAFVVTDFGILAIIYLIIHRKKIKDKKKEELKQENN